MSDGAHFGGGQNGQDAYAHRLIPTAYGGNNTAGANDVATAVRAKGGTGHGDFESETFLVEGADASEDGTGRGTPIVPVAFHGAQDPDVSGDVTHPVGRNRGLETCVAQHLRVRRLTPRECERLQGFPDDYTLIPRKNGAPAADGPRYKALGNSMAVNVMRLIGERIATVHAIPITEELRIAAE